jgi:uncharacterized membrane protein YjfL (UPF0719 family)
MRYRSLLTTAALILATATEAAAQVAPGPTNVARARAFWDQCFAALFFGLLAIGLILAAFRLLHLAVRFDVQREVCENRNVAAAILATGIALGVCLVVAAVLVS